MLEPGYRSVIERHPELAEFIEQCDDSMSPAEIRRAMAEPFDPTEMPSSEMIRRYRKAVQSTSQGHFERRLRHG